MKIMDDETQLKVRKFLKRLGISSQQELNQFIENNPDVQDLSIKVLWFSKPVRPSLIASS